MHKKNMNKIKSAVVSSVVAVSAMATPLSAVVMNASAANDNYAKLLQYSMYFYDANMCGKQVGETSAMSWRDDCHTSDAVDGGFHDAGDHVKFGLPAGYSASTLGWSYYEFKDAYDATGQGNHLKTITDYFATFFKNSTTLSGDTVTNFVYQIGDGEADHHEWCAPEMQDSSSRKTFSTTSGASDIAAEYAAALAVNYVNFGNAEDLKYAKALFEFSTKYNQKATDGTGGFYDSFDYYDDQAWAAGWLYKATNDNSYKEFLNTYMNTSNQGSSGQDGCQWGIYSTHSWNNVSMGAGILQAEITGNSADWKKVTDYLNSKGANSSDYYFELQWGSARYNTAQQMAALVATKYGAASYNDWAKGQMDYIIGNKGVGSASPHCFVVGFDSNSSKNPHHRAASGYSSDAERGDNTQISPNGHTLVGALVGGPLDANGTYSDVLTDYTANEVTIDYNATLVGAAAGLYSVYKTGSVDSSIEGVKNVSSGNPSVTSPVQTNATTAPIVTTTTTTVYNPTPTPSNEDITLTPSQMTVGTEAGEDGELNTYAEFNPQGAKSVTFYYKVNSNDTNTSGAFGTWNGDWLQEDFKNIDVPSNKVVSVDYTIPSNVGSTVKAMVFWPHGDGVTIEKVVLHMGGSSSVVTQPTTQPNQTTTTTTQPQVVKKDVTLNKSDMTVGTETGDDGGINNYAEFNPQGAKSVTFYYKVNSNDMNTSGAFGTWNGDWLQEDFKNVAVPAGSVVAVDYTIPANAGSTIKAMVFWPHGDAVSIEKIVLHMESAAPQTTTTTTTTKTTTTTTTTKVPSGNLKKGDVNGDGSVNVADAVYIMQTLSNPNDYKLNDAQKAAADVVGNGDGVTAQDALAIQLIGINVLTADQFPISSIEDYIK